MIRCQLTTKHSQGNLGSNVDGWKELPEVRTTRSHVLATVASHGHISTPPHRHLQVEPIVGSPVITCELTP